MPASEIVLRTVRARSSEVTETAARAADARSATGAQEQQRTARQRLRRERARLSWRGSGLSTNKPLPPAEREKQRVRELVKSWDRLVVAYDAAVPRLEVDPTLAGTRERLVQFCQVL